MKLPVFNLDGKQTDESVELLPAVFDIEPNDHAIALAVQTEMTRRRQGTASTKNRSLVQGGGKKPWRQKGRGAARAGTIRSPLWRGGGTIFGPQPHPYFFGLNKKVNRLARRSALTYKARLEKIRVLNDFNWDDGKTVNARNFLKAFAEKSKPILLLTAEYDSNIYNACKNVVGFEVIKATDVSTRQILKSENVYIQKSALSSIEEVLNK